MGAVLGAASDFGNGVYEARQEGENGMDAALSGAGYLGRQLLGDAVTGGIGAAGAGVLLNGTLDSLPPQVQRQVMREAAEMLGLDIETLIKTLMG